MVNVDVSPSVVLGVGLIGAGVSLWQIRRWVLQAIAYCDIISCYAFALLQLPQWCLSIGSCELEVRRPLGDMCCCLALHDASRCNGLRQQQQQRGRACQQDVRTPLSVASSGRSHWCELCAGLGAGSSRGSAGTMTSSSPASRCWWAASSSSRWDRWLRSMVGWLLWRPVMRLGKRSLWLGFTDLPALVSGC
jgi:hypothetical protein